MRTPANLPSAPIVCAVLLLALACGGGGVTLSGGEALAQPGFVAEICQRCHFLGIRTTLETSLHATPEALELVLPHLDLLYADIKHMDRDRHQALTGLDNVLILANLRAVSARRHPPALIIRMPVIPSINDEAENLRALAEFCTGLAPVQKIELLPYHRLSVSMYRELGQEYALHGIKTPSREYMVEKAMLVRSFAPNLEVITR